MRSFARTWLGIIFLCWFHLLPAQEMRVYLDLQLHPAMHMAYPFFGDGLTWFPEDEPPQLSHKHLLKNVLYANLLVKNPGARVLVHGAIVPETNASSARARRMVIEQLDFIEGFVKDHPDQFALARSPSELRRLVAETDKTVFVHSIEGGKHLLDSYEDACYWASRGVAFITLVHLMDDEHGAAATKPEMSTRLINLRGGWAKMLHKERGLTDKGKQAIRWLRQAGIMTDLTHMSDQTRQDALELMEAEGIPPLVTHDLFRPVQNHPRGLEPEDIRRIYALGGMISLPISGASNLPHEAREPYRSELEAAAATHCHCPGAVDSYLYTYQVVQRWIEGEVAQGFTGLSEEEKVRFAIGFQSDFNGWLNHSRPRYGPEGCWPVPADRQPLAIELEGMPHPGLLSSQWAWMEQQGADLSPILRASERFTQMWEQFLEESAATSCRPPNF